MKEDLGIPERLTDQCADAGPCPRSQEPAAWRYEFSAPRQVDGYRDGSLVWHVGYSEKPPQFSVRNLTPLYAHTGSGLV